MKSATSAAASPTLLPWLALALLSLNWGYSWIVLKIGLRHAHALDFSALRTGLGALCLFMMLLLTRRKLLPARGRWREIIVLGLVQTTLYVGLSMWALIAGAAGNTAVLVFTMPFWTLLLAHIFLHERLQAGQRWAVCIAAAGLILMIRPWSLPGTWFSQILAVSAGLAWASSSIVLKRLQARGKMDTLCLANWQALFGALPLLVLPLLFNTPEIKWNDEFLMAVAYSAVITTALGWWLWIYVLDHLPAGVASVTALAIPAIALTASAWQLNERPSDMDLLGIGLIGSALALIALTRPR